MNTSKCWLFKRTGRCSVNYTSNFYNYLRRKLKMKEEKIVELRSMLEEVQEQMELMDEENN